MAGSRSAGLLLYRRDQGAIKVLLGHMGGPYWASRDAHAWTIPKGEYGPDDDPLAAAQREFEEELGSAPPTTAVPRMLGEVRQSGGKVVTAWALEADLEVSSARSNTFELEWPPRSGRMQTFPEIDRVAWFDLDIAREKIVAGQAPFLDRIAASTLPRDLVAEASGNADPEPDQRGD
jgi:predicted NUDIX family NTP pyrophosphohydrolase